MYGVGDMANPKNLGEILVARKLLTRAQLQQARDAQRRSAMSLASTVVSLGLVTEEMLLRALAAEWHVAAWSLEKDRPQAAAVAKLPTAACRQYQMLPVEIRGDLLLVAMRNPGDLDAIELARNVSQMRVEPVLAHEDRLAAEIENWSGAGVDSARIDGHVQRALAEVDRRDPNASAPVELMEEETRPVVGLVNQILGDAIRMRASDVHFEPARRGIELRFRIDGQLVKIRDIPNDLQSMLVTRIKIMAELDIVEQRVPQDGRMTVAMHGRNVDLRVSALPSIHGQRIVLRVLDRQAGIRSLESIGFAPDNLARLRKLVHRPYGLFLVTGPTGSGKTTTLYGALAEVKTEANNVMTCEDPVEYEMPGIAQSQVNEKIGLTFATQLRAILRQDPDVILVGEIRDQETAETAIRASLTGHLVMSTLHCNDALSAVPRMLDMGVEPYLLSTSLVGVMAQRLVRKVCPACAGERAPSSEEAEIFQAHNLPVPGAIPQARGCGDCFQIGYRGRTAISELLPVTSEIAAQIAAKAPVAAIAESGAAHGFRPMQGDALDLVMSGLTTLEEVQRVVSFDECAASERPPSLRVA